MRKEPDPKGKNDDAYRPEPVTLGELKSKRLKMSVHCRKCGHWAFTDPAILTLPDERTIPSLDGAFSCTRCASRDSCAMPVYPRPKPGAI
ncbi:MAG: hypothetical protein WBO55_19995 [Rhizobiaceae bacterium]